MTMQIFYLRELIDETTCSMLDSNMWYGSAYWFNNNNQSLWIPFFCKNKNISKCQKSDQVGFPRQGKQRGNGSKQKLSKTTWDGWRRVWMASTPRLMKQQKIEKEVIFEWSAGIAAIQAAQLILQVSKNGGSDDDGEKSDPRIKVSQSVRQEDRGSSIPSCPSPIQLFSQVQNVINGRILVMSSAKSIWKYLLLRTKQHCHWELPARICLNALLYFTHTVAGQNYIGERVILSHPLQIIASAPTTVVGIVADWVDWGLACAIVLRGRWFEERCAGAIFHLVDPFEEWLALLTLDEVATFADHLSSIWQGLYACNCNWLATGARRTKELQTNKRPPGRCFLFTLLSTESEIRSVDLL